MKENKSITFSEKILKLLIKSSTKFDFNEILIGCITSLIWTLNSAREISSEKKIELCERILDEVKNYILMQERKSN